MKIKRRNANPWKVVDREKAILKDQDPRDVMTWLLKAQDDGDNSAPPGEGAFQEDSRLMIIAGRYVLMNGEA